MSADTPRPPLEGSPPGSVDLVYLCAGKGTRVGLDQPKQFVMLQGQPLMAYALAAFQKMRFVRQKIIVFAPSAAGIIETIIREFGITDCRLVPGGETRQDSVRAGLAHVATDRVLTHNAAVPFVTETMVNKALAEPADCVTTVTEIQDNMVRFENNRLHPVSRQGLQVINSPQSFHTAKFRDAHERARQEGRQFASDAELMLHYGHTLALVPGPAWSFKVTDRVDLALAETVLTRADLFPDPFRP